MLTARPQKNLIHAKGYFREHLTQGDYYSEGHNVQGTWFGKGAERLGLEPGQPVTEAAFVRLCDNLHPVTGQKLTVRQRKKNRRVFFDFAITPNKSVSIMAEVAGDERIVAAHDASCVAAAVQLEKFAATRIHSHGATSSRVTGEIVAAVFRHDSSRSLDPLLHSHYVVFNATFDPVELRWKALETRHIFDAIHFLTEVYRNEMANRLQAMGYRLRHTDHGFEIEGVSEKIIQQFSKGRRAILAEAKRLELELKHELSNNSRAAIAHNLRARKLRHLSAVELRTLQRAQLSPGELAALEQLKLGVPMPALNPALGTTAVQRVRAPQGQTGDVGKKSDAGAATTVPESAAHTKAAIDFARDHLFERKSVVNRAELLAVALRRGRGQVTVEGLEAELAGRTEFLADDNTLAVRSGLALEQELIAFVNAGVEQCRPLRAIYLGREDLTGEQNQALAVLLKSPDQVVSLKGAAGAGKTEVLKAFVEAIRDDHQVVLLAPTTGSVKTLHEKALDLASTVQKFLIGTQANDRLNHPVVIVDEAGLLCNRQMLELMHLVHQKHGRLLLSGDSRQHASVEAGDALRILERFSCLQTVGLHQIQRQKKADYREAIADLARGCTARAVARLKRLGAVTVVEAEDERCARAAEEYVASVQTGKSALVVCPTWDEVDATNLEIRSRLQELRKISRRERKVSCHRSLKWTLAQKRDLQGYKAGQVLDFHASTQSFKAGESAEVIQVHPDRVIVRKSKSETATITRKQAGCFDVARVLPTQVAPGDRLLIQGNRKADRLFNGQTVTVEQVRNDGSIALANGLVIPPDFRRFTHAHAVTSQTAQGRTVDHVYVVMNRFSEAANLKSLYVGASRGRDRVRLFCDSDDTLASACERPGTRLSAIEMLEKARVRQNQEISQRVSVKAKV